MAKLEPYWVFHEGMLQQALDEHVRTRTAGGATEEAARAEVDAVRLFLASPAARSLRGDRG